MGKEQDARETASPLRDFDADKTSFTTLVGEDPDFRDKTILTIAAAQAIGGFIEKSIVTASLVEDPEKKKYYFQQLWKIGCGLNTIGYNGDTKKIATLIEDKILRAHLLAVAT